jgi:hypothetical protein
LAIAEEHHEQEQKKKNRAMASPSTAVLSALVVALACAATTVEARFTALQWTPAHATFYGDETAAETMGTSLVTMPPS